MANIDPINDPAVIARFQKKYRENTNGCWIWTGSKDKDGYGQFRLNGVIQRAHRVSWLIAGQPLDPDKDLDHLCHIRRCVNPAHLEEVEHMENMRRIHGEEDWKEHSKGLTSPQQILQWADDVIDVSGLERPFLSPGADGYGMHTVEGAPWRECYIDASGYMPHDKYSFISLYLHCVSLGVDWRVAATEILTVSPFTLKNWSAVNPMWLEDFEQARTAGRLARFAHVEARLMDALEERMDDAEYKDLVRLRESYNKRDDMELRRKEPREGAAPASAPRVQLVFNGSPDKQAELLSRVVRVLAPAHEEDEDDDE